MTCSKCGIQSDTDPCPECKRLFEDLPKRSRPNDPSQSGAPS